jgi:hypothetical protein
LLPSSHLLFYLVFSEAELSLYWYAHIIGAAEMSEADMRRFMNHTIKDENAAVSCEVCSFSFCSFLFNLVLQAFSVLYIPMYISFLFAACCVLRMADC